MGFLGDIANSGIGSDLLSLYNAQKEVESRDALRQIQQGQLEEKKRADLQAEANRMQQRDLEDKRMSLDIFKSIQGKDPVLAGKFYKALVQPKFKELVGVEYGAEKKDNGVVEYITEKHPVTQEPIVYHKAPGMTRFELLKPEPTKAPQSRSITRGDTHVDQEFDSATKTWKDVSSGPRYKPSAAPAYDKNIEIAAQSIGIPPERVRSGKLTKEEATKLAEAHSKMFGSQNIVAQLLQGLGKGQPPPTGNTSQSPPRYDKNGNRLP